jgi:hypothetical protein
LHFTLNQQTTQRQLHQWVTNAHVDETNNDCINLLSVFFLVKQSSHHHSRLRCSLNSLAVVQSSDYETTAFNAMALDFTSDTVRQTDPPLQPLYSYLVTRLLMRPPLFVELVHQSSPAANVDRSTHVLLPASTVRRIAQQSCCYRQPLCSRPDSCPSSCFRRSQHQRIINKSKKEKTKKDQNN